MQRRRLQIRHILQRVTISASRLDFKDGVNIHLLAMDHASLVAGNARPSIMSLSEVCRYVALVSCMPGSHSCCAVTYFITAFHTSQILSTTRDGLFRFLFVLHKRQARCLCAFVGSYRLDLYIHAVSPEVRGRRTSVLRRPDCRVPAGVYAAYKLGMPFPREATPSPPPTDDVLHCKHEVGYTMDLNHCAAPLRL